MEKLDYPNKGNGKSVEQNLQALRGYINGMVEILNYNFEQIENALNEKKKGEDE